MKRAPCRSPRVLDFKGAGSCVRRFGRVALGIWLRIATVVLTIWRLLRALPSIRAADNITMYPAGGFAYTLIVPDWMRRLFPHQRNVTLLGSWAGRHNEAVPQIWNGALVLIPQSVTIPGVGTISDLKWSERLFRAIAVPMRLLWPQKNFLFRTDLMRVSPRPNFVPADSFFAGRNECYYYHLVVTQPLPAPRLPRTVQERVEAIIAGRCPSQLPRSCNLYLREKGDRAAEDLSAGRRISASLQAYLPAIRHVIANGYRVFLTGDRELPDHVRREFGNDFVDWRTIGFDKDLYHVYVGLNTDAHIGNLSGGSSYVHVADIPALMVDAFPFGDGLPFTTVHYKRLLDGAGRLVPPARLLNEFFFDHDCVGHTILDTMPEEILAAVADWLPHAMRRRPYGIHPDDLGVTAPWLKTADARLSPVWLEGFERPQLAGADDVGLNNLPASRLSNRVARI